MSDTTKTLDELFDDEFFLDSLRNGKFCLVLGAGFSYGKDEKNRIKNKVIHPNPLYQHIPTTKDFIEITKTEFGKSSVSFPDAATLWEKSFQTDNSKKELFRNLFLADEVAFKETYLKIYKEIFTPNWHRIFTFNFDNVLEAADKGKEYLPLFYPEDREFKDNRPKQIAHVHGRITETSDVMSLVFFGMKYAELQDSDNSLYYSLINPIISNNEPKDLLILGCQFNENIQLQKFYKNITGIPRPKIYQIGLAEPLVSGERDNYDYTFIKAPTYEFLQKIIEKKAKIENIQIEGATVVTKDFIEEVDKIGKKENYNPDDFYLAKQYDNCQWFGIINNWDIERDAYRKIKDDIKAAFDDKYRQPKIITLIHGRGGSGKSTLLRRLAVDLMTEDFAVLWLNDKEINRFVEKGLQELSEYPHKNFLILIEDWYRIKQNTENAKEIITSLCSYPNVRIIIGDRTIDNSISLEHVYNPEQNIIELKAIENKSTIEKILEIVPHWKDAASKLLIQPNDYDSSLYLILWTIARFYQISTNKPSERIGIDNLIGHFRSIVESDLRAIEKYYPGVAKMLYYWASVYSEMKTYISFDLFFVLADLFKNQYDDESKLAIASSEVKSVLDIYINKAEGIIKTAKNLTLIAFNHDILADEGLSRAKLADWHLFDDSIKLKILPEIIDKGDDMSASNFLIYSSKTIRTGIFLAQKKKEYIEKLLIKGNLGSYLQIGLKSDIYKQSEKNELAKKILTQKEFWKLPEQIVCIAMIISGEQHIKDKAARDILTQHEFWKLPHQIVSTAMTISGEQQTKDKAAKDILTQHEFWKLPPNIVSTAMTISGEQQTKDKAAKDILTQHEFWKLPPNIVSTAMTISGEQQTKDKAAKDILTQHEFWKLPHQIVCTAMTICREQQTKDKAAKDILTQHEFWKLPEQIVCTAMTISGEQHIKDKAAKDILTQHEFWKLPDAIVCTAMTISGEQQTKDKAAKDILTQHEFWKLPEQIVCTAMTISGEQHIKDKAAKDILTQHEFWKLHPNIVSTAMTISGEQQTKDKAAKDILTQHEFWKLPHQIVSTAMTISGEQQTKDKAAKDILTQHEFWKFPKEIVSTAMTISGEQQTKDKAAKDILTQHEFWKFPKEIVSTAMTISGEQQTKDKAAKDILTNEKWLQLDSVLLTKSFKIYSEQEIIPAFVKNKVEEIINGFFSPKRPKYYKIYLFLLAIPFRKIPLWKSTCDSIISNPSKANISFVVRVIYSHRNHPSEIHNLCKKILLNWKTEIKKEIRQRKRHEPHYGDQIRLAMGHPDLHSLIKQTAGEILKNEEEIPIRVRQYFLEISKKIIDENIFPEWNLNPDHE